MISSVDVSPSTWLVKVYVNHYSAMDYVKFYVRYKTKFGSWTGYYYKGTDYTPTTGGDYYKSWTHPAGYYRMQVKVSAYNSGGLWLGSDYDIQAISGGGGGPPPPPLE